MIQAFAPYASIIILILQAGFAVFMLLMKSRFVSKEEHGKTAEHISTLSDEVTQVSLRLDFMEREVKQLPSAKDLHALSLQITTLDGSIGAISEKFKGFDKLTDRLQTQVDRIDGFLKGN